MIKYGIPTIDDVSYKCVGGVHTLYDERFYKHENFKLPIVQMGDSLSIDQIHQRFGDINIKSLYEYHFDAIAKHGINISFNTETPVVRGGTMSASHYQDQKKAEGAYLGIHSKELFRHIRQQCSADENMKSMKVDESEPLLPLHGEIQEYTESRSVKL